MTNLDSLDPVADGSSLDVVSRNMDAMRELFPEVFSEGRVDFETLRDLLGDYIDDRQERYSFTWSGKGAARRIAQTPSMGTLRPARKDSIRWEDTQNVFIEGDNLEVLKLLQKSYYGRVKMIYIDPPYNTGNEFIYPDKYQDNLDTYLRYTGQINADGLKLSANAETSGRYHTNWLNMMYPRLKLACNLLRSDGSIFISIDDHEVHNLRHMCDEIFGPENFVSDMIWQSRTSISNDQEVSLNHNHTLIYSKSRDELVFYGEPLNENEYSNPDDDARGPWKLVPLDANKPGGDTQYGVVNPKTGEEYWPPNGRSWAVNSAEMSRLIADGRIKFGQRDDSAPKRKLYLNERKAKGDTKTPSSLLLDAGTTKDGTTEMMALFGGQKVFDYPKPVAFMSRLLNYGCGEEQGAIALDFFAGSCSLAHAVLAREVDTRFIAVQLPELVDAAKPYGKAAAGLGLTNIAEIGKERIRRAIEALRVSGMPHSSDLGFRVFRLDSSNISAWDPHATRLEASLIDVVDNLKSDRDADDIMFELLLKNGLDLGTNVQTERVKGCDVFVAADAALVVVLGDAVGEGVASDILEMRSRYAPEVIRVIFQDSGFESDVAKTNVIEALRQAGIHDVKCI